MSLFNDGFMNVEEAAKYVGCSVNFLRVRARDGRIQSYRMGKLYRFKAEDLQTLIRPSHPTANANDSID